MYASLSAKQLLKRFAINSGFYGAAIAFSRLGTLFLLPVYWSKLSPLDFGIIGLAQLVTVFLIPIISLGLNDAVQRMFYEWPESERSYYLAAIWTTTIIFSFFICLSLNFLGENLFSFLISQVDFFPFITLTIWISFFANLSLLPMTIMRADEERKKFSIITILMFLTQSTAILFFLFICEWNAVGYLAGSFVSFLLWSIYFIYFMVERCQFPWRLSNLMGAMRYALPLIPSSIFEGMGSIFDRLFLDKYVTLNLIGIYNVGNQIGGSINSLNQALKTSWFPFIMRVVNERKDAPIILGTFSIYYIAIMIIPCMAVSLFASDFINFFGGPQFAYVSALVPWFVLIQYLNSIGTAMGRGIDLAKKTIYSSLVPLVAVVVNFSSMFFLVPVFGLWGAVTAFAITMACRVGTQIFIAYLLYPRPLFLLKLLKINCIAVFFLIIGFNMNNYGFLLSLSTKLACLVFAASFIFFSILDRKHLKEFFSAN